MSASICFGVACGLPCNIIATPQHIHTTQINPTHVQMCRCTDSDKPTDQGSECRAAGDAARVPMRHSGDALSVCRNFLQISKFIAPQNGSSHHSTVCSRSIKHATHKHESRDAQHGTAQPQAPHPPSPCDIEHVFARGVRFAQKLRVMAHSGHSRAQTHTAACAQPQPLSARHVPPHPAPCTLRCTHYRRALRSRFQSNSPVLRRTASRSRLRAPTHTTRQAQAQAPAWFGAIRCRLPTNQPLLSTNMSIIRIIWSVSSVQSPSAQRQL